jgi:predicted RNase H-like HicB family nuclease
MVIQWEPQGGVFVVTVPELPGCRTHGATYEEAVLQGKDAIESWLMGMDPDRVPAPEFFDLEGDDPSAWQRAWKRTELRRAS